MSVGWLAVTGDPLIAETIIGHIYITTHYHIYLFYLFSKEGVTGHKQPKPALTIRYRVTPIGGHETCFGGHSSHLKTRLILMIGRHVFAS